MQTLIQPSRSMKVLYVLLALAVLLLGFNAYDQSQQEQFEKMLKGKAPTRKGEVKTEVINASPLNAPVVAASLTASAGSKKASSVAWSSSRGLVGPAVDRKNFSPLAMLAKRPRPAGS